MEIDELKRAHADCVGAVAGAAWRAWAVGVAITIVTGLAYVAYLYSEPWRNLVLSMWGVTDITARQVYIMAVGLMKLIMLLGLLGCIFLSSLAKRLRAAYRI
ncbi:MAG: hypothetical protein JXL80_11790 [Planctomycetes bacterium]|nr:hypothetical protein [Planctomycetota bacterium]